MIARRNPSSWAIGCSMPAATEYLPPSIHDMRREPLAEPVCTRLDYVYRKPDSRWSTEEEADVMRILVERSLFLEGCRLAERVLPVRTTEVARTHLLVQAGGDTCTLHAAGAGIALRL